MFLIRFYKAFGAFGNTVLKDLLAPTYRLVPKPLPHFGFCFLVFVCLVGLFLQQHSSGKYPDLH